MVGNSQKSEAMAEFFAAELSARASTGKYATDEIVDVADGRPLDSFRGRL